MNLFLIYLIKSTISLTFLYSLFRLTMRKHKSHTANRFLLLGIIVVSSLIPFIHVNSTPENLVAQKVESITSYFTPSNEYLEPDVRPTQIVNSIPQAAKAKFNFFEVFYVSLLILLSLRLVISIFHVFRLIHKAEKTKLQDIILAIIKESIQPFSFMKYIVLSESDHYKNKEILIVHEYEHIRQWHGLDLILVELFTLVHCINPMAWLLRRDLKLIHEFQADQAVLNKGIDVQKYQLLVLEKAVGERRFAMATHFNQPPVKKRLNMMNKTKEKQWHSLKIILYIPLLFLLLQAFAKPEIIEKVSNISTSIIQADPSEQWVDQWVEQAMNKIENPVDSIKFTNGDNVLVASPLAWGDNSSEVLSEKNYQYGMLLQNAIGELAFDGESIVRSSDFKRIDSSDLKNEIKSFVLGQTPIYRATVNENGDSLRIVTDLSGKIIQYRHDEGTPKEKIRETMEAIANAYLEMREDASQQIYDKDYFQLGNQKRSYIDKVIPIQIIVPFPGKVANVISTPIVPTIVYFTINKDGSILDNR